MPRDALGRRILGGLVADRYDEDYYIEDEAVSAGG